MTWASVSFDHKRSSEGDFLLRYSEDMSKPVVYYFYWSKQVELVILI